MSINSEERITDLDSVMMHLTASEQAFKTYYKWNRTYQEAVKAQQGVEALLDINDQFTNAKYACRKAFRKAVATLDCVGARYDGDPMSEVFTTIQLHLAMWNLDYVRSKYAALWMNEFCKRFAKIKDMGDRLNEIDLLRSQIDEVADEPFPTGLPPASQNTP